MLQAVANPPQFLGPSSHARIYTFLIGHTWDIYGQLAVYLRLAEAKTGKAIKKRPRLGLAGVPGEELRP